MVTLFQNLASIVTVIIMVTEAPWCLEIHADIITSRLRLMFIWTLPTLGFLYPLIENTNQTSGANELISASNKESII